MYHCSKFISLYTTKYKTTSQNQSQMQFKCTQKKDFYNQVGVQHYQTVSDNHLEPIIGG